MSLASKMLDRGFAVNLMQVHGEPVRILTGAHAGETFQAVFEVQPVMDFSTDLGGDPREKNIVQFAKDAWPRSIASQDILQDEAGDKWRVVQREDNGHDTSVNFEVQKIVGGGIDE